MKVLVGLGIEQLDLKQPINFPEEFDRLVELGIIQAEPVEPEPEPETKETKVNFIPIGNHTYRVPGVKRSPTTGQYITGDK
jgi:hypothetical protein